MHIPLALQVGGFVMVGVSGLLGLVNVISSSAPYSARVVVNVGSIRISVC